MALRALMGVAAALFATAPTSAEWRVVISDHGNIRSSTLVGFGEDDPQQQIAIICTTTGGERSSDPVVTVATPSSGEFTVLPGDRADVVFSSGPARWNLNSEVLVNDSSAFAASSREPAALDIARLLSEDHGSVSVMVASGAIDLAIEMGPEGAAEAARQFLDACGSM